MTAPMTWLHTKLAFGRFNLSESTTFPTIASILFWTWAAIAKPTFVSSAINSLKWVSVQDRLKVDCDVVFTRGSPSTPQKRAPIFLSECKIIEVPTLSLLASFADLQSRSFQCSFARLFWLHYWIYPASPEGSPERTPCPISFLGHRPKLQTTSSTLCEANECHGVPPSSGHIPCAFREMRNVWFIVSLRHFLANCVRYLIYSAF